MKSNTARAAGAEHLSVIHNASLHFTKKTVENEDAILQTDLQFNIIGWNAAAEALHGQPGAGGKNLFELVDFDFIDGDLQNLQHELTSRGFWSGEVLFRRFDGKQAHFKTTATYIIKEDNDTPSAILIVCHNINNIKQKERLLEAEQKKYEILMDTLPQGVMMINRDGNVEACNKRGATILGLTESDIIGKPVATPKWKAIKADGSHFPMSEFPAIVSLQTGFPQRNVIVGIETPDGSLKWLSVNSEALLQPGEFEAYAAVVSYTDITESKKTEEELKRSNERFYHVSKVTSDAIWDIDLTTNQIYRSGAFRRLSGYTVDEIDSNLNWWFTKVHKEDIDRVKNKLQEHIDKGIERWEDEYRFQCADSSYKHFHDSGVIIYKGSKAIRVLGAIRDLTEQKKLEKQLLDEQLQRQKAITMATIAAQEQEKTNISRELHDNVNQILMSSKLFMDTARRTPDQAKELLDKAIEYQLLALQEIRKISKSLSTSNVKTVGLKESIEDVIGNMELVQEVEIELIFNERVEDKLSDDQKLMLFRIVQEQTNNIIKYASAKSVQIMVNESNNIARMMIADDGVGFDTSGKGTKGIGFINIISRADAYSGKVDIVSSPGNGCTLEVCFPIN